MANVMYQDNPVHQTLFQVNFKFRLQRRFKGERGKKYNWQNESCLVVGRNSIEAEYIAIELIKQILDCKGLKYELKINEVYQKREVDDEITE